MLILVMLCRDFYRGIFIGSYNFIELTLLRITSNSCVMFTRVTRRMTVDNATLSAFIVALYSTRSADCESYFAQLIKLFSMIVLPKCDRCWSIAFDNSRICYNIGTYTESVATNNRIIVFFRCILISQSFLIRLISV